MIEYKMPYQSDRKQGDLDDGREITAPWNYFREYQVEQLRGIFEENLEREIISFLSKYHFVVFFLHLF